MYIFIIYIDDNTNLISKPYKYKTGYRFDKSERPSMAKKNNVPGPGQYRRVSDFDWFFCIMDNYCK